MEGIVLRVALWAPLRPPRHHKLRYWKSCLCVWSIVLIVVHVSSSFQLWNQPNIIT